MEIIRKAKGSELMIIIFIKIACLWIEVIFDGQALDRIIALVQNLLKWQTIQRLYLCQNVYDFETVLIFYDKTKVEFNLELFCFC